MPQVYRRHSEHNPRPSLVPRRRSSMVPTAPPEVTDADGSIVLADLVRTGEASRLRRRGAMRVDHTTGGATRAPISSNPGPSSYAPPARPIIIEPSRSPSPELNADGVGTDEYTYTTAPVSRGWAGSIPPPPGRGVEGTQAVEILSESSQAGQAFTLFCGGEEASIEENEEQPRWEPALFAGISSPSSSRAQARPLRKTNGCGEVVHVRAYPQRPRGVWLAKEAATETVVSLDSAYCDHVAMDKMLKSACGCIREGIGCAVCGNTLGTRYVPCQAASESIFSPTVSNPPASFSPRPIRPFGPGYWNPRPSSHHLRSAGVPSPAYYTFFADRVTASPTPGLPNCNTVAPVPEPRRSIPGRPATPIVDYGYPWTTSPQPNSDALPPSGEREAPPLSPVFALPPLPSITRNSSQLRPFSTRLGLDIPPLLSVNTPSGEPGLNLDADGMPLVDIEEPSSPDKESISWSGR